jgi:hypothetical protein
MLASVILVLLIFLCCSGMSGYESRAIQNRVWERHVMTDYPGNDIKDIMPISRAGCAQWCQDTPGCTGFVRDNVNSQCWLKKSMDRPVKLNPFGDRNRNGYILM